jgi:hypothetical protein
MWNTNKNRRLEIFIIVIAGAIVSVINTLLLRENLINEIKKIARRVEANIVNSKVTNISTKINSQDN